METTEISIPKALWFLRYNEMYNLIYCTACQVAIPPVQVFDHGHNTHNVRPEEEADIQLWAETCSANDSATFLPRSVETAIEGIKAEPGLKCGHCLCSVRKAKSLWSHHSTHHFGLPKQFTPVTVHQLWLNNKRLTYIEGTEHVPASSTVADAPPLHLAPNKAMTGQPDAVPSRELPPREADASALALCPYCGLPTSGSRYPIARRVESLATPHRTHNTELGSATLTLSTQCQLPT
jgi:hypothetical protein